MNSRSPVNGSTYLVLGILSITICPLLGPLTWSMSENALSVLDEYENGGEAGQRGLVAAERICGMIGTVLFLILVCMFLGRGCGLPLPRWSAG